jgi:hypothetical protein
MKFWNFEGYKGDFFELVRRRVPISMVTGEFDGICNYKITENVFEGFKGWGKEWKRLRWMRNVWGRLKVLGGVKHEIVSGAAHCVGCHDANKEITYRKIEELVRGGVPGDFE